MNDCNLESAGDGDVDRADRRRVLCICADDFGMSIGINAAILELANDGKISAAGCMVKRSAWRLGMGAMRQIAPARLDVGLHLDFGYPDLGDQTDRGVAPLIARSYLGLLSQAAVKQEIRTQLHRFEVSMGRAPAFVDGHQHVHQLPLIRQVLLEELAARYGAQLPWLRSTMPPVNSWREAAKGKIIFALGGAALKADAERQGIATNRRLLGVYDFSGSQQAQTERLAHCLRSCRTGDVLMCHPSMREFEQGVAHARARFHEYQSLRETRFPYMLNETDGVEIEPLSALLRLGSDNE